MKPSSRSFINSNRLFPRLVGHGYEVIKATDEIRNRPALISYTGTYTFFYITNVRKYSICLTLKENGKIIIIP